jgi:uncharacterized protein (TIGR00730 family)
MNGIKRIAVFCGSSSGSKPEYTRMAEDLGNAMARRNIGLIYGGGGIGLMGTLANSVLAAGGNVSGYIPDFFNRKDVAHNGLKELVYVPSMHERKLRMANAADGFIALPGGFGTMDELFEIITWGQLDLHRKPVGLLNVAGYYDDLLTFIDKMYAEGFLREAHHQMLIRETSPEALLDKMQAYQAPDQSKWIDQIKA